MCFTGMRTLAMGDASLLHVQHTNGWMLDDEDPIARWHYGTPSHEEHREIASKASRNTGTVLSETDENVT